MNLFENLFSSQGRINRVQFLVQNIILSQIGTLLLLYLFIKELNSMTWIAALVIVGVWIYIASSIKRIHDIGISKNWIIAAFVPWANFLFVLYLLFKTGITSENGEQELLVE